MEWMLSEYEVTNRVMEIFWKLDSDNGCTTLWILKTTELYILKWLKEWINNNKKEKQGISEYNLHLIEQCLAYNGYSINISERINKNLFKKQTKTKTGRSQKEPNIALEIKSTFCEIRKSMNELNSKLDKAEDRMCKLEDSYDEITQNAAQRNKTQNTREINRHGGQNEKV